MYVEIYNSRANAQYDGHNPIPFCPHNKIQAKGCNTRDDARLAGDYEVTKGKRQDIALPLRKRCSIDW